MKRKTENSIFRAVIFGFLTAAALTAAACSQPIGPEVSLPPADRGVVNIRLGAGESGVSASRSARTLLPGSGAFDAYDMVFTVAEGQSGTAQSFTDTMSLTAALLPGTYDLAFTGKKETLAAATGTYQNITVTTGSTEDITVPLVFKPGAGAGTLSFSITRPSEFSLSGASFDLSPLFSGGSSYGTDWLKALYIDYGQGIPSSLSSNEHIGSGYYLATVTLSTPERRAVKSDIVHIGAGHSTTLNWTFSAGDFKTIITGIWLVGIPSWGTEAPNTVVPAENPDGTCTWRVQAAADATFRFILDDTTSYGDKWWARWFHPETDGTTVSAANTYAMLFSEGKPDLAWKLENAGWYSLTVNPYEKTLSVQPHTTPAISAALITNADKDKLELTFSEDVLVSGEAPYGFTLTRDGEPELFITGKTGSGTAYTFTLNREAAEGEIIALTYSGDTVTSKDDDIPLAPAASQAVNNTVKAYPVITSAVIENSAKNKLVLTFSKTVTITGSTGFTVTGSPDDISITNVTGNGTAWTFTLNREAASGETITLAYTGDGNMVIDGDGNPLKPTTKAITFWAPPELVSAIIYQASPFNLVLSFNENVAASSSAGFSVNGSATAARFTTGVSGSGTATLTLTLNLKPAYGETLLLSYNSALGNVAHSSDSSVVLADFTNESVALNGFSAENDSRPTMLSVVIDADSNNDSTATPDEAKTIYVTYDKAVTATNANGFSISGSVTALDITGISGSGTSTLALALDDWPSLSEEGTFTLSYSMDLGNVCDYAGSDNLALSFSAVAVDFENYTALGDNVDTAPPRLVSATVEDSSSSVVRVVFNEPVTVDKDKFFVKVNDVPYTSMAAAPPASGILLDLQKRTDRTITSAVAAGGGMSAAAWELTMSAPALHGEILRLASSAAGAAQDLSTDVNGYPAPNSLAQIPQFIVNNKVKRVKGAFEDTLGLYINGTKVASVTDGNGGQLYENAVAYLHTRKFVNGDIVTIVLDTNQTLTTLPSWWSSGINNNQLPDTDGNSYRVIVTTTGDTDITIENRQTSGAMFQSRNGMTLVIDEHVIFKGSSSYSTPGSLIQMMDGGSIIMDGGEIREHLCLRPAGTTGENNDIHGGAIRLGGGKRGGYLIINGGKITENTAKFRSGGSPSISNGGAGGIIVLQYGVVVMTGGEISNNTMDITDASAIPGSALAGGIMANTNNAQRHGNASFFMTGGEISGNRVTPGSYTVGSAGGVLISGTFQKTGGTIYGADAGDTTRRNITTLIGNRASAVFVSGSTGANPGTPAAGSVHGKREDTAGPEVTLFVESYKSGTSTTAVNTVPDWATSYWDVVE